MRREEYLGNAGEQQYFNNEGLQARLWTALPGIITAVDYTKFTVSVQPAIMGKTEDAEGVQTDVQLPMLVDVPVLFPNAGGWHLTCPIQVNDECLVVFASRCIDAWWQNGGVQKPMELRMNDLSDGFCILAPYSQPMASEVTGGFSNNSIIIRDDVKENYLEFVTGGDVNVLHQANLDWDTLGNADIYIKGNTVVKIDGTLDATVEGATTITCNSTLDATVQDNVTLTCNANVTETVQGNLSATVQGNTSLQSTGPISVKTSATLTAEAAGSATIKAPSITLDAPNVACTGNLSIAGGLSQGAGGARMARAGGDAYFAGNINTDGTITAQGDVVGAGISLSGHIHGNGNNGANTTGPM